MCVRTYRQIIIFVYKKSCRLLAQYAQGSRMLRILSYSLYGVNLFIMRIKLKKKIITKWFSYQCLYLI